MKRFMKSFFLKEIVDTDVTVLRQQDEPASESSAAQLISRVNQDPWLVSVVVQGGVIE